MQRHQIYKCGTGAWVEILDGSTCGDLACCGEPMKAMEEQTADSTKEKHVPLIQDVPEGTKVVVGSVPHPMLENHYIQVIELIDGDFVYRKFLKPGEPPEAVFPIKAKNAVAREICNLHGVWKG